MPRAMPLAHARTGVTHALRRRAACVAAVGVTFAGAVTAATATASVVQRTASLENGTLSEFDITDVKNGVIVNTAERGGFDGTHAAKASFAGGSRGFARVIDKVAWSATEDVWYGAAMYLPTGFKSRLTSNTAVIRRDNWPRYGMSADFGGLSLYGSDKKLHLVKGTIAKGDVSQLVSPVEVPEGRWFHIEVHQKLSTGTSAVNEVYIDGRLARRSTTPNSHGRAAQRLRWGIVAPSSSKQTKSLTMYFDRATISPVRMGLPGRAPPAPTLPPPSTPTPRPTPPAALPAPTIYVAATGTSSTGSGATPDAPVTLARAEALAVPGSVVGFLPGTYYMDGYVWEKGGTASRPIMLRRYGAPGSVLFRYNGSGADAVFQFAGTADYTEINGLYVQGDPVGATSPSQWAARAFHGSTGAHHLTIRDNRIWNMGAAGMVLHAGDYYTVINNQIYHVGYDPNKGWSSGISLHEYVWQDDYQGFHNYIVGNEVSGCYDASAANTDGNGIILDNGGASSDTPWTLIANNVTWQNGGNGIDITNARRAWIVNNTTVHNALDTSVGYGELEATGSKVSDLRVVNNTTVAYSGNPPFAFGTAAATTTTLRRNIEWGGVASTALPVGVAGKPHLLRRVDPLLRNPLASADNRYGSAVAPWNIGDRLKPTDGSPLIGAGVDPRALPEATTEFDAGMTKWLGTDVTGSSRVQNGAWDVGAYEVG